MFVKNHVLLTLDTWGQKVEVMRLSILMSFPTASQKAICKTAQLYYSEIRKIPGKDTHYWTETIHIQNFISEVYLKLKLSKKCELPLEVGR